MKKWTWILIAVVLVGLIGGASLDAESFAQLVKQAENA